MSDVTICESTSILPYRLTMKPWRQEKGMSLIRTQVVQVYIYSHAYLMMCHINYRKTGIRWVKSCTQHCTFQQYYRTKNKTLTRTSFSRNTFFLARLTQHWLLNVTNTWDSWVGSVYQYLVTGGGWMSTFHSLHPDKGDICTYIISIYTSHTCTSEFLFILER